MRNRRLIGLVAVLAMVAMACGGDQGGSGTDGAFRVAIVAPSASNDVAFTQSIVDAVNALEGEFEIDVTDGTFVVEEAAAAIRDYADQGYDLVIAHGSQYGASLEEIAKDFPDVAFAWGTATDTFGLPNVSSYTAAADQGGYVLGVMAAMMSSSGNVGVVGPIEVGDAKLYVDGFRNGAEASGANVSVNYIGSFSDVGLASEAAEAHVAAGSDVMTGSAQMVVGAIGVALSNDVLWFGTQANQTSLGPDVVVASQVYKWEVVLQGLIDGLSDGDLGGETHEITLENGGLVIEFNDGASIPDDVRQAADDAIEGIKTGSVSTGA